MVGGMADFGHFLVGESHVTEVYKLQNRNWIVSLRISFMMHTEKYFPQISLIMVLAQYPEITIQRKRRIRLVSVCRKREKELSQSTI